MTLSSFNRILFLLFILMISGCAAKNVKSPTPDEIEANAVDNPLQAGKLASDAGDYPAAIRHFRSAESSSSFNDKLKQQSMLELSYAYFKVSDYYSAVAVANRFIQDFPASPHSDYAYYLKALAYYEQAIQSLDAPVEESNPAVMQTPMAQLCIQTFEKLMTLFPNSRYSGDGEKRLDHLRNRLADRGLLQAEQYFEQGDFANAALYAKQVIDIYPNSNYMLQATSLLSRAYQQIGLVQEEEEVAVASMETGMDAVGLELEADLVAASMLIPMPAPIAATQPTLEAQPVLEPQAIKTEMPVVTKASEAVSTSVLASPSMAVEGGMEAQPLISDGETWISAQQPAHYTIQIMSSSDESSMKVFIKKQGLGDAAVYYRVDHQGGVLYRLLYGTYETLAAAKASVSSLAPNLSNNQPWIRSFASVQAQLNVSP